MADLHEATREDMEEEAPNELVRRERDAAAALGRETNAVGIDALQALIGKTNAMRVAAEVAKDLLRPAERALGVDDPLDAVQRVDELLKGDRISEALAWFHRSSSSPARYARVSAARNFPRNRRESTCTGNR